MRKDNFFSILAVLLIIIAVMQIGGVYFEIYKKIEWWDTAIHFLGGVWIGGMSLWFLTRTKKTVPSIVSLAIISLGSAFAVGFVWELYEIAVLKVFDLAFFADYTRDTITDLVADSAGGFVVAFLFLWLHKKR